MKQTTKRGGGPSILMIIVMVFVVAAGVLALAQSPPSGEEGLVARLTNILTMLRNARLEAEARIKQAKRAFHLARSESQQSLMAQFEAAKQRGGLRPL